MIFYSNEACTKKVAGPIRTEQKKRKMQLESGIRTTIWSVNGEKIKMSYKKIISFEYTVWFLVCCGLNLVFPEWEDYFAFEKGTLESYFSSLILISAYMTLVNFWNLLKLFIFQRLDWTKKEICSTQIHVIGTLAAVFIGGRYFYLFGLILLLLNSVMLLLMLKKIRNMTD